MRGSHVAESNEIAWYLRLVIAFVKLCEGVTRWRRRKPTKPNSKPKRKNPMASKPKPNKRVPKKPTATTRKPKKPMA
jgi:hypothetical protein